MQTRMRDHLEEIMLVETKKDSQEEAGNADKGWILLAAAADLLFDY